MQWDKSLECGGEQIDNEHKELFKMVNDLAHGLKEKHFKETSQKALDFLGQYVVNHFAHEEEVMKKICYPHAHEHKETHVKFIKTFHDLNEKLQKSSDSDSMKVAIEIKHAAMSWLVNHIKVIDQRFTDYYKSQK